MKKLNEKLNTVSILQTPIDRYFISEKLQKDSIALTFYTLLKRQNSINKNFVDMCNKASEDIWDYGPPATITELNTIIKKYFKQNTEKAILCTLLYYLRLDEIPKGIIL